MGITWDGWGVRGRYSTETRGEEVEEEVEEEK